jgi:hypothetical protein
VTKECCREGKFGKRVARLCKYPQCVRPVALLGLIAMHLIRAEAVVPKPCGGGPPRERSVPLMGPGREFLPPPLPCVGAPVGPGGWKRPGGPPAPETVPPKIAQALTSMAQQAAVIFTGQVRSIDHEEAHGYVDVSFTVEQALRGTSATRYVLREWAGLWIGQPERYRLGERMLLLLRSRSRSGFSSPVGGLDGALPILSGSLPPLPDSTGQIPADRGNASQSGLDPSSLCVDLRWIATRVQRTPVASSNRAFTALPTASAHAGIALSAVLAVLRAAPEESADAR